MGTVRQREARGECRQPWGDVGMPAAGQDADAWPGADAFDVWLQRGLHDLFDAVAQGPVPDELLKLLQGDHSR